MLSVSAKRGFRHFYGWKLVGLAMVATALASGPVWNGVGVWIKALELEFGWSRAQLTGAFSLAALEGSVIGPFIGYFIDRLGPRRMAFIGLFLMGLGFIMFSRTTNLPIFYLSYILIMTGTAAGTWLPFNTAINRWFIRKRGRAMAVSGEGSFLGGLLIVPLLAWSVAPDHLGWSDTALVTGIIFLAVAWPMSRFIRERPEDYGDYPDGDLPPDPLGDQSATGYRETSTSGEVDFTARQALRTSAFWFITLGHGLSSMLIATLSAHLVPLLTDQGLSLQTAAYVWAVLMAAGAVSQLVGGYLGDRFPIKLVLFGFTGLQAVGFILAAFIHTLPMAILVAVIYGAGFGGRAPLTTAIRGEYFGKKAFATITGISMGPMNLMMLAAPMLAAIMFDARGSYTLAFLILGSLGSMSGVCFLLAKKPQVADRAQTMSAAKSRA